MKNGVGILAILLISGLSLPACHVIRSWFSPQEQGSVLHVGNESEIETMDPHRSTGVPENRVIIACFEGLMRFDPKTSGAILGVAESVTRHAKGRGYTFRLRKNARWSDGSSVTAHDFVYSFRRILDPKLASQYAFMLYPIQNAKAIHEGKIPDATKLGVVAKDNHTLVAMLERPVPYFTELLAHYSFYPVPKKVLEQHGDRWTQPGNVLCNGPFVLESAVLQDRRTFVRNPHYWDSGNVHFDRLVIHAIDNKVTRVRKFQNRELHLSYEVVQTEIPKFQGTAEYRAAPFLGAYYYILNTKRPPLQDRRVRRAMALVLDRKAITSQILTAGQTSAYSLVPPGIANYGSFVSPLLENIQEAKRLLVQAGYPDGKGLPEMELLYNTDVDHERVALAAVDMWKQHLGIVIKPYNREWKVYLAEKRMKNFQLARASWVGDFNDASTFLDMWTSGNPFNDAQWVNAKYDALVAKSEKELHLGKRAKLLMQAEQILLTDLPIIPIYHYTATALVTPKLEGWYTNILDVHPYVGLRLSQ